MQRDKSPIDGARSYSIDPSGDLNADPKYRGAKNFYEQAMLDLGLTTWSPGVNFARPSSRGRDISQDTDSQ
jgi:hypothetical protein